MLKVNSESQYNELGQFPVDVVYNNQKYTVDVYYDLGGWDTERGYYLSVNKGTQGEYDVIGKRVLLNEVARKSKKQAGIACDLGNQVIEKYVQKFDEYITNFYG